LAPIALPSLNDDPIQVSPLFDVVSVAPIALPSLNDDSFQASPLFDVVSVVPIALPSPNNDPIQVSPSFDVNGSSSMLQFRWDCVPVIWAVWL